jgi:putative ABC transport system permease protein
MSQKLASILGVAVGDRLELTPVRGRRETSTAPLASIIESYLGLECYADLDYLSRIVGEARAINGVQLQVDPSRQASLYAALKQLPNAQGLSVRADTQRNIEATLIETSVFSLGVLIIFAGVIAFGSMLTASVLEIEDRRRDIATFRVLGYRPRQITGIFLRQNLLVFALGLLASLPLGYGMVQGMAKAYDTELFRMPVIVRWSTIARTGLLAIAFVAAAQWFVHRRICRLDWLEDVQTKE